MHGEGKLTAARSIMSDFQSAQNRDRAIYTSTSWTCVCDLVPVSPTEVSSQECMTTPGAAPGRSVMPENSEGIPRRSQAEM